jgi:hypothetical protein
LVWRFNYWRFGFWVVSEKLSVLYASCVLIVWVFFDLVKDVLLRSFLY